MSTDQFSRRSFIKATAMLSAGAYMLAFSDGSTAADNKATLTLNYLRIAPDGIVTVISPVAEIGQGTSTALPMVVADALDADWQLVRFELAPVAPQFNSPILKTQLTGASTGVSGFHDLYRDAGATARTMLIAAAARQWKVPADECATDTGKVVHAKSGRSLPYGELASRAAVEPVPATTSKASRKGTNLVKTPVRRLDIPAKVNGTAQFAIDVRLPDMLYATVVASPVFGGTLVRDARADILKQKGIKGVYDLPDGVAIVADRWWTARRARDTLAAEWDAGKHAQLDDKSISAQFWRDLEGSGGVLVKSVGTPEQTIKAAKENVTARYEVPFLAHATMEPMSCVARVRGATCDVWVGSQRPDKAREVAASLLGLPPQAVTIHPVLGGGGFGRRQEADFVAQAVQVAKQFPGRPVKLVWTREEDTQHDYYRPAGVSEMSAGLNGKDVIAFRHKQATPTILPRTFPDFMGEFDSVVTDNIFSLYGFPHQDGRWVRSETPVPTGMWRSVGASQTVFAIESFVDELAAKTGTDPYQFRRRLLAADPRALAVLDRLAAISGWGKPLAGQRAIGLAISHKHLDCLVGQSAEVSVEDGQVVVHRICTVADPGKVINPDTARAQMEGAAIWGLSAALFGKISITGGRVQQSNFHDYRVVRLSESPAFTTEIIESGAPFEGMGEGGAPGIAPAVCNAIFQLTGKRIRTLPIADQLATSKGTT
ncbi:xanthine dehydrogenase family protein molybdopterin-binding subunit [Pseudoduganella lutea]|uniref:Xanthine dehydrogenase family protein molybdopterin-binding subunit n=1 Tax=Pseudoduganella lutea TaxID=321985 RepID=A0A4P6L4W9_9BURK|nr:xanthine dehydrogenase family protein molybdopterin-binding subunit [Pseudoduganella lutea]QBE66385.1 xanthine dehydrogenase family protein molybdopterin-binding subunit [Pseudoduganella lutea]